MTRRRALYTGAAVLGAGALVVAAAALPVDALVDAFSEVLGAAGAWAGPTYVVAYVVASVLLLPASAALTVLSGAVFGFGYGVALGLVANAAACWVQWWMGRRLSTKTDALVRSQPLLEALEAAARRRTFVVIALARLSPAIPFGALNLAAGARRLPALPYAIGSAIGLAPSELAFLWIGASLARTAAADGAEVTLGTAGTAVGVAATLALLIVLGNGAARALRAEGTALDPGSRADDPQPTPGTAAPHDGRN